jgi:Kelch motif/Galactose oxidase, central domain
MRTVGSGLERSWSGVVFPAINEIARSDSGIERDPMNLSAHRTTRGISLLVAVALVALLAAIGVGASPGSWTPTGSMPTPRTSHTATRLADGRVLAAGGLTVGPAATASSELFDPGSGTWSAAANMNVARSRHIAVLLADGRVLVAGGRLASNVHTASAELYDPETNTWTLTAPMSVGRDNFTATILDDGRVLVAGGVGGDGSGAVVEKSAETYDPVAGQWASAGKMANRRFNHAAVRLSDGRVLVTGGAGPAGDCIYTATAEIFSPATRSWKAAAPMATPRGAHASVLLPSGLALAAGGLTLPASCVPAGFQATESGEVYDAEADRWSPTGSMASARRVFGDAQLADGSVLVAGGRSATGALLDSAELYNPASGSWTSAGSMTSQRVAVRLTTLADGQVLATGGGGPAPLSSAELYAP